MLNQKIHTAIMSQSHDTAIILAAGKGTRMKSDLPKVMHHVAGRSMIGHVLSTAAEAGCSAPIVVIREGMDAVKDEIAVHAPGATTAYQIAKEGTGAAVLSAKDAATQKDRVTFILYGDTPLIRPETLSAMREVLTEKNAVLTVLGMHPKEPGKYGRLDCNTAGELEAIIEYKDASDAQRAITLCNSGVMAVRSDLLFSLLDEVTNDNAAGEYYLTDIVAIARGRGLTCFVVEGDEAEMLGVNSRIELAQAEAAMQQRLRELAMANGVTLLDPASTYFSYDTQIDSDTLIEPNVFFGLHVTIGKGCHIKAFSHIEGSVIANKSIVGPFARLRPGTNLGESVKVGNFVEIKKSEIERGAKISHLSYIGDASIGIDANIGAGTITCNYDGYNKYRTEIGAGSFIGSNTSLVAPVTIGDGAIIGAGSVVTEDVESDSLTVARERQSSKKDWAKDFREKNSG